MNKITLISNQLCPYAQRISISLSEKNLAFERVNIDLSNKPDWFLKLSPRGKVPVLKTKDGVIFESSAILEYLDDVYEPTLHPKAPVLRARNRAWVEYISDTLNKIAAYYSAKNEEAFRQKEASLNENLAVLEGEMSSDGPYFNGEEFSLVDVCAAPMFRYFDAFEACIGINFLNDKPKLVAWRESLNGRASVKLVNTKEYRDALKGFLMRRRSYISIEALDHLDAG